MAQPYFWPSQPLPKGRDQLGGRSLISKYKNERTNAIAERAPQPPTPRADTKAGMRQGDFNLAADLIFARKKTRVGLGSNWRCRSLECFELWDCATVRGGRHFLNAADPFLPCEIPRRCSSAFSAAGARRRRPHLSLLTIQYCNLNN